MANTNKNKINVDWIKGLEEHMQQQPVEVPADWKSVKTIAKSLGVSETHARKAVRTAYDKGLLRMRKFLIVAGTRIYPVPHYQPIEDDD